MRKSRWSSTDYKSFKAGDIICYKEKQAHLQLIIKVDEKAIWCAGLVHAALTENNDKHPVYPIYFDEIEKGGWDEFLRLGNLDDYKEYIERVQDECK